MIIYEWIVNLFILALSFGILMVSIILLPMAVDGIIARFRK